jgi:Tfp pilus assembly protein PilN
MIVTPVNLLPKQLRKKRLQTQIITACVAGALLGAAGVAVLTVVMNELQHSLQRSLEQGKPVISTISTADASALADASARIAALNALAVREVNWGAVFVKAGAMTARDITVREVGVTRGLTQITYRLAGTAPSTVSYATYLETLRSLDGVVVVTEEGSTYAAGTGTVTFSVQVGVTIEPLLVLPQKGAGL